MSSLRERLRALVSLALGALPVALPPPFFVLVAAAMEGDAGVQAFTGALLDEVGYGASALVALVCSQKSCDVLGKGGEIRCRKGSSALAKVEFRRVVLAVEMYVDGWVVYEQRARRSKSTLVNGSRRKEELAGELCALRTDGGGAD